MYLLQKFRGINFVAEMFQGTIYDGDKKGWNVLHDQTLAKANMSANEMKR